MDHQAPGGDDTPVGGLWAWYEGRFYTMKLEGENRHMDHVTWFANLGIPDYGPGFDRVLRGRMTWDWHFDHFVLNYYGTTHLPNQLYQQINKFFNPSNEKVVERQTSVHWM